MGNHIQCFKNFANANSRKFYIELLVTIMSKFIHITFLALAVCVLAAQGIRRSVRGKKNFKCTWISGKGTGQEQELFNKPLLSGQRCVNMCYRMSKTKKGKNINAVTEYKDTKKKGCWCVHKIHDISPNLDEFKTCYFKLPKSAAVHPEPVLSALPPGGKCSSGKKPVLKGCYDVYARGKYIHTKRLTIDWSKQGHPKYAWNFVCACADAAKKAGIKMFATHFWGECWELKEKDLARKSEDGCRLADGLYMTNTCDDSNACLGVVGYAVYTY